MNKKIKVLMKIVPLPLVLISMFVASIKPVQAAVPGTNTMASVSTAGTQGGGGSAYPSMSRDGKLVAFSSSATLDWTDSNEREDIFVRDLVNNTTERVSVSTSGVQSNNSSRSPVISGDGRYVVFYSFATNLIDGLTFSGATSHVYVHDLQANTTEMIDISPTGARGDAAGGDIDGQDISDDGRFVVFKTGATNIDPSYGETSSLYKIFVRDRLKGTSTLISRNAAADLPNGHSNYPSMSCDGAFVVFESSASNLVSGDTDTHQDIFLVQRVGGDYITRLTQTTTGSSEVPKISCNGNFVTMTTDAQLNSSDTDSQYDDYVYNRLNNSFDRVNVNSSGAVANVEAGLSTATSVSDDGRYAAFISGATNLDSLATDGTLQVYMRDRLNGTTELVSKNTTPSAGNGDSGNPGINRSNPEINPLGTVVAYSSKATNLTGSFDANGVLIDIFVAPTGN